MSEKPTVEPEMLALLAETDALFEPVRDWSKNQTVAGVWERRSAYLEKGLPCHLGGGSGSERAAAFRQAEAWEESGAVVFHRERGKRVAWKLSDAEDLRIRWWTLQATEEQTLAAMRCILQNAKAGFVHGGGRLVPEIALTGGRGWGDESGEFLMRVEGVLAPALCRGWVDATSDIQGHVAYGLTPAGEKWLDEWSGPTVELGDADYDSDTACRLCDRYDKALQAARKRLEAAKSSRPGHVVIPLSAGMWPGGDPAGPGILDEVGIVVS